MPLSGGGGGTGGTGGSPAGVGSRAQPLNVAVFHDGSTYRKWAQSNEGRSVLVDLMRENRGEIFG